MQAEGELFHFPLPFWGSSTHGSVDAQESAERSANACANSLLESNQGSGSNKELACEHDRGRHAAINHGRGTPSQFPLLV